MDVLPPHLQTVECARDVPLLNELFTARLWSVWLVLIEVLDLVPIFALFIIKRFHRLRDDLVVELRGQAVRVLLERDDVRRHGNAGPRPLIGYHFHLVLQLLI